MLGAHLSPSDILGPPAATLNIVCSALNDATVYPFARATAVSRSCQQSDYALVSELDWTKSASTHEAFMADDMWKSTA